ncbi:MAG TPA: DUF2147 domain-containing protein [Burkholderiales bacterium]|nr:DUF2147 domain-containing protein [Burkholderiales bacterium]
MKLKLSMYIVGQIFGCLVVLAWSLAASAEPFDSPVGLWKIVDDQTGQPRAIIRITETNGEFQGTIEKGLRPGENENSICEKCEGSRHNQRLLGMAIVTGIRKQGDEYAGGEILDPDNGTVYRCKMRLEDGGTKLQVRGFVGVSLFGRTQTWVRVE